MFIRIASERPGRARERPWPVHGPVVRQGAARVRPAAGNVMLIPVPDERTEPTAMTTGYSQLPNERISAVNGVDYAYRDTGAAGAGPGAVPLVLLQHFRGNLDNWDPALIDLLAASRRVVTFDNAGVGGSAGTTPDTIEQMARDAIAFVAAMDFCQVDLLGFSIGSFVAQQIALTRP